MDGGRDTAQAEAAGENAHERDVPAMTMKAVVVGASAGGVEALTALVAALPAGLPAAVAVALHVGAGSANLLPRILSRAGPLPAVLAEDGMPMQAGQIAVAPADRHLLVQDGRYHVTHGARESRHRPAIDPLFRSAARSYGDGVIGVLLSGADDDGSEGLLMIKAHAGIAIVQKPETALFDRMPCSALAQVAVDYVLPPAEIAARVARLVENVDDRQRGDRGAAAMSGETDPEADLARVEQEISEWERGEPITSSSGFTCPLCGGGIWYAPEGKLERFRCHTGHAFSAESFVEEQGELLESTLWNAVRALSERSALLRRMAAPPASLPTEAASRYEENAAELDQGVALLRELLQRTDVGRLEAS